MLNFIWIFMILSSVVVGTINGNIGEVVQAAFEGANSGVQTVIGFVGVTALWNGIMSVAEESGLIKAFTRIIRPVNLIIFPELKKEKRAMEAVSANMVANILGLSNAATPLGIRAMQELDRINGYDSVASNAMCMFAIINAASIQLIPSTMIGIRASMGSVNPSEIIVPIWIVSVITATFGVVYAKICVKKSIIKIRSR